MKLTHYLCIALLLRGYACSAQSLAKDQSVTYQEERMVFKQWDQDKFTPKPGFLSLNPYYWLTWGLFHPDYHKTDLRPLSTTGPQTQRLALVAAMNAVDNKYKLQSDTLRNTELSEIANHSGLVTGADPLWLLYYSKQLKPVLNSSPETILQGLSAEVSAKMVSEGLYDWYKNELDMLKERVNTARSTTLDRGARIMAYHRYLLEYRRLAAVWSTRTSAAQMTMDMTAAQQRVKANLSGVPDWTPESDIRIANKVLQHVQ